jgi:hypothetical protein
VKLVQNDPIIEEYFMQVYTVFANEGSHHDESLNVKQMGLDVDDIENENENAMSHSKEELQFCIEI